jgi:hypothetical protein
MPKSSNNNIIEAAMRNIRYAVVNCPVATNMHGGVDAVGVDTFNDMTPYSTIGGDCRSVNNTDMSIAFMRGGDPTEHLNVSSPERGRYMDFDVSGGGNANDIFNKPNHDVSNVDKNTMTSFNISSTVNDAPVSNKPSNAFEISPAPLLPNSKPAAVSDNSHSGGSDISSGIANSDMKAIKNFILQEQNGGCPCSEGGSSVSSQQPVDFDVLQGGKSTHRGKKSHKVSREEGESEEEKEKKKKSSSSSSTTSSSSENKKKSSDDSEQVTSDGELSGGNSDNKYEQTSSATAADYVLNVKRYFSSDNSDALGSSGGIKLKNYLNRNRSR